MKAKTLSWGHSLLSYLSTVLHPSLLSWQSTSLQTWQAPGRFDQGERFVPDTIFISLCDIPHLAGQVNLGTLELSQTPAKPGLGSPTCHQGLGLGRGLPASIQSQPHTPQKGCCVWVHLCGSCPLLSAGHGQRTLGRSRPLSRVPWA